MRAQCLLMGAAETGDARGGSAEGEPDPGFSAGSCGASRLSGETVLSAERQPRPSTRLVLRKEDRPALAPRPACHLFSNETATTEIYTLSLHDLFAPQM